MKKIKWKSINFSTCVYARIGGIRLQCFRVEMLAVWYPRISTGKWNHIQRDGKMSHSLAKAKEDAVQLACELLLDYQAGLSAEMKNFDLVE